MTDKHDIKILDDTEHVLLRPSMYIGPTAPEKKEFWIPSKGKMEWKEISYIPGLFKIFCEVLDNAVDEHQRGFCKTIDVEVNTEKGYYKIKDDGRGISPEKHECGRYTPEVVFTMLRSGSNFDDSDRNTIGMNGVGCALTNIFSSMFTIEIFRDGKLYKQTMKENNQIIDKPVIRKKKRGKTGTQVCFWPDETIFSEKLDNRLIYKRCLELSYMFPDLTINLTIDGKNKKFIGKKFEDFVKLFGDEYQVIDDKKNNYRLAILKSDGTGFQHYSIVNGADVWRGGTHVDFMKETFVAKLREIFKKEYKEELTSYDAGKNLMVILFQKLNAPQFDGQTKEKLSTDRKEIEKVFSEITPRKITSMVKGCPSMLEQIYEIFSAKNEAKEMAELRKMQKKVKQKRIPKLIDCSSKNRMGCTLYITEGDSAVSGISSVRDPKTQAGLPLRGKILNVSGMSPKEIIANKEIQTLMSAIGLEFGKSPVKVVRGKVEATTLRYGNISILTDADHDGSAIRCLLINFFFRFWPELFEYGIITISEAPLYEVIDGKKTEFFYERAKYENYVKRKRNIQVSYFKGLGSCDKNGWDFFINKQPKMYKIKPDDASKLKLEMAFGNDTDKRKEWLRRE